MNSLKNQRDALNSALDSIKQKLNQSAEFAIVNSVYKNCKLQLDEIRELYKKH